MILGHRFVVRIKIKDFMQTFPNMLKQNLKLKL